MHDDVLSTTRDRLARARAHAGPEAGLVAYDINGIQEYVTANSRPRAIHGASDLIKGFDADSAEREGHLFSGGGRGLFLVPARAADDLCRALVDAYRAASHVGVVAAASVPFDPAAEHASLQHLRLALDDAKDAALPPFDPAPPRKERCCERCHRYDITGERPAGDRVEHLCKRCVTVTDRGLRANNHGLKLVELVEEGGVPRGHHVAALSADGNDMGALFAALPSLEATVAVSLAVARIFTDAHEEALRACGCGERQVSPVTGGDDIRVFLAPWFVAPYVEALTAAVHRGAEQAAASLAAVLPEAVKLAGLGVGIGVVAADVKSPASRMIERAHALERAAKAHCRRRPARSAIAWAWDTGGESFDPRDLPRDVPTAAIGKDWLAAVARAQALAAVPSSQRTVIAERAGMPDDGFANLFRYQVARSTAWQRWYDATGTPWRDREAVVKGAPTAADLTLLRFVRGGEGA